MLVVGFNEQEGLVLPYYKSATSMISIFFRYYRHFVSNLKIYYLTIKRNDCIMYLLVKTYFETGNYSKTEGKEACSYNLPARFADGQRDPCS